MEYKAEQEGNDRNRKDQGIMEKKGKNIDRFFLSCIILCTVIAFLSFFPFIHQGNGAFTLRDDFNTQQLTFNNYMNGFLKHFFPGEWSWSLDVGCSFIQGFGFYGLGSPFSWLSFLFPREAFPYVAGWLFMLKYLAAGIFAYIYFRTMTGKSGWPEVFGAVVYAFSGFQAANLLFHFHDVVALFPLMLTGMERMEKGKGSLLFSFSVFINCLVNYYFFTSEVIFLILYFLFRFCRQEHLFNRFIRCFLAGTLGVGMACVLFVPSIIYILENPRAMNHLSVSEHLLPDLKQILYILKGMLMPGDTMHDQAALFSARWSSTACWLPLCGCSLPIAYVMKKRDWLSILLILLTTISFSPFLSSVFIFFTQNYQRWWYMLTLLYALAAVKVLHDLEEFPIKRMACLNLALLVVFYATIRHMDSQGEPDNQVVFHPFRFKMFFVVAVAGLMVLLIAGCIYQISLKTACFILLAGVSVSACATTLFTIYSYKQDEESTQEVMRFFETAEQIEDFDPQYRYEFEYWSNFYTMGGDAAGVGSFSSTMGNCRFEFHDLFEYENVVRSLNKMMYTGLSELFGAKYVLKTNPKADETIVKKISTEKGDSYIVEKPACPIGFKVDQYILKDDLLHIRKKKRGIALLHASVINETDEELIRDAADRITKEDIDFKKDISILVNETENRKVKEFERDSFGFRCTTDYSEDSLVYFSVPNDPGWEAEIDDVKTSLINSGGMILIKVPAGKHRISFKYHTPGLFAGTVISAVSFLLFAVLAVCGRRSRR